MRGRRAILSYPRQEEEPTRRNDSTDTNRVIPLAPSQVRATIVEDGHEHTVELLTVQII